jgi:DAK2 domain fusion protein YloV
VSRTKINAGEFQLMVQAGCSELAANADYVNSLNVFPVPDGDTGTNMTMSMTSGTKAVVDSASENVGELTQAFAKGLLMGARGNSGVILSQLFRGFSKAVADEKELDGKQLASAFSHGVETAYQAVMKPVEGTILTVAREGAKAGEKAAEETEDALEVMEAVLRNAKRALALTPDLLPVLKEVGVVDSGGQGLVFIYEGFIQALQGKYVPGEKEKGHQPTVAEMDEMVNAAHHRSVQSQISVKEIKFGYCTEIMVKIGDGPTVDSKFDPDTMRDHIGKMGNSLVFVYDDEIIKVHVHTEHPGDVLNYGQKFGSLIKIKIENMRVQHETIMEHDQEVKDFVQPPKDLAVMAIAAGDGLQKLFKSLGVDFVLSGGQTMNPSTEDIAKGIKETNAKQVLLLPNNKNIFMAADSAAEVAGIPVKIVKTKTISQGLSAMLGYNPTESLEQNAQAMTESSKGVVSGEVTYATRDTSIDHLQIKKDEFIGIVNGKIVVSDADIQKSTIATLEKMITPDTEILTVIYGKGGTNKQAKAILDAVLKKHPDLESEIHEGGQPVYPYLMSAE